MLANCVAINHASLSLLSKLGFKKIKIEKDGTTGLDHIYYELKNYK
ncbi:MAG TPA: hypothetical protein DCY20_09660 [Firmicutes bacterium]|nr:hypothetical protein [Bacillota bacterium]